VELDRDEPGVGAERGADAEPGAETVTASAGSDIFHVFHVFHTVADCGVGGVGGVGGSGGAGGSGIDDSSWPLNEDTVTFMTCAWSTPT
jgi:hypothetical protein